ncbi:MAG: hypothetical protein GX663_06340 [Clostridiales bacterium]|nr:hypothetical protein [Clostridiales bacterium]
MNNLDPRTRIMMIIAISGAAMFVDKISWLVGLLLLSVAIMLIGKIDFVCLKKQLMGAVGMVVFLFILQAAFGNIYLGALLAVRLLIIIMSAMILLTGQMRDYLLALIQCRMPYELAYMVVLAFHFFPILREEALDVYYSIQLRGTELRRTSVRHKLTAFRRICMPILAGALERAKDTSVAMEARGFRAYNQRTYMRKLKLKKRDAAILIAAPVLAVAFVFAAHYNPVDGVMDRQAAISIMGENAVSISWSSQEEYNGIVECNGKEFKAQCTEVREGRYYRYTAVLEDLKDGKDYEYSVGDGKEMSAKSRFTAGGEETEEFEFLYIGDIQYKLRDRDYGAWGNMIKAAYQDNSDAAFGVFAGDMVDKPSETDDWDALFANGEPVFSRIPMMTTVGNHETSIRPTIYLKMMVLPEDSPLPEEFYSFDYGQCHFVALNSCLFMKERKSEEGYEDTVEAINKWLAQDLQKSQAKWTIAYMHHPMYPVAEDDELYRELRSNWEEIFADNHVDLVLCGHQHVYMRTEPIKGITYVMSNSGNKASNYVKESIKLPNYVKEFYQDLPTYSDVKVAKDKIEFKVFKEGGELVDSFKITK